MVSSLSAGEISRHPAHRDIPALGGKVKPLAMSPSSFFHRPNGRDFCKRKGRVLQGIGEVPLMAWSTLHTSFISWAGWVKVSS